MAYHDTLSPTGVLTAETRKTSGFLGLVGAFFRSLGDSMTKGAVARARYETLRQLQAKTDAELAQLGLKRDQLVRHVFGDLYYS